MLKNTETSYGSAARGFHWLIFLLFIASLVYVNIAGGMEDGPEKGQIIGIHKSIGVSIFILVVFRLGWRLGNPRPADLGTNELQNKLAHAVHWLFYIILLVQPIAGILMSQYFGYPVSWFGIFELPMMVAENKETAELFHELHEIIAIVLLLAVLIHLAAALKHHFVDKNRTLVRMWKGE
jgi:cytochrome b561